MARFLQWSAHLDSCPVGLGVSLPLFGVSQTEAVPLDHAAVLCCADCLPQPALVFIRHFTLLPSRQASWFAALLPRAECVCVAGVTFGSVAASACSSMLSADHARAAGRVVATPIRMAWCS